MLERLFGRAQNLVAPIEQLPAEIGPLAVAHKGLVVGRAVIFGKLSFSPHETRALKRPFPYFDLPARTFPSGSHEVVQSLLAASYLRKRIDKSRRRHRLTKAQTPQTQTLQIGHVWGHQTEAEFSRQTERAF